MKRFLIAALFIAIPAIAFAVVGQAPIPATGPGLVDGTWLNGLAGGQNFLYQYGLKTAGTNQATATQLLPGYSLMEVDTSDSGGAQGVALPACLAGLRISLNNNTAYTFDVYPSIAANPITTTQDTINNGTSTNITTYAVKTFSCAKHGVWSAQ